MNEKILSNYLIYTMIRKLDQVRTQTNNVNVIQSYGSMVKNNTEAGRSKAGSSELTQVRKVIFSNCQKEGKKRRSLNL